MIFLRNYFGFSRTETRAMYILMPLILLVLSFNLLPLSDWVHYRQDPEISQKILDSLWQSLDKKIGENNQYSNYAKTPVSKHDSSKKASQSTSKRKVPSVRSQYREQDINLADTTALKKIYGIGSKLSSRIVKYRELLGGFYSMNQLYEVYYLDSPVVERVKERFVVSKDFIPIRIKLNQASLEILAKHPYLSYQEARLIVAYRSQNGQFHKAEQLLEIPVFTDDKIARLTPYLSFSEE